MSVSDKIRHDQKSIEKVAIVAGPTLKRYPQDKVPPLEN